MTLPPAAPELPLTRRPTECASADDTRVTNLRPRQPDVQPQQAYDATRLETLGRLVTAVAHDVNNVLTVVGGHAELLADAVPPGSAARESAAVIRAAAGHATGLARRLLALARPAVGPVPVDVAALLAELTPLVRAIAGGAVRVTVAADPDLPPVAADPTQLEQVVLNLVANAHDAMPHGGDLEVWAGVVGQTVCLAVTDTGTGIDPATLARVFDPFFTTKGPAGTGVGLTTVREVVTRLGGRVAVESEPGRGATFRVFLPAADVAPEAGEAGRDTDAGESTWIPAGTVLLVDDHPGAREVARALLEGAGYDVLEADTGDGAARLARAVPSAIDVLVTDVVLPGLGGRKLAEKLRADRPGLAVVFVSGYPQPAADGDPGTAFVAKPYRWAELVSAVRRVMRTAAAPLT